MGEVNRTKKRNYPAKRKSRINAPKLTKKNVTAALKDTAGILDIAAKRLQVSRAWLHEFIARDPDLVEIRKNEKERFIDLAEAKLIKKVQEESDWAIKYTLSTLGKKRGYESNESNNINIIQGEKQLVVVSDGEVQGRVNKKDKEEEA